MSFPLIGNERVKAAVNAFTSENRLPHAILIEGENGLGKRTLAHFLSRAAVCEGDNPPCALCRGCHLAETGSHPDISVISPEDGKKNISVAQIRTARNEVYIKPHMAKKRVFIIERADSMNEQAQNAFLKVLEEPPADILFILLAESVNFLLDTVISRCTVLSLAPPEISAAERYLSENTNFSAEQISEAIRVSNGNMGMALSSLSGGGTKAHNSANLFLKALLNKNSAEMLKITYPFEKSRAEADLFLKELKLSVAEEIKKSYSKPLIAKALLIFSNELNNFEESLKTNINLGLLFCATVSAAEGLNI